jgi:hypothetical protein
VGGAGVPSTAVPTVRSGPTSHQTIPEPVFGSFSLFNPCHGFESAERPGSRTGLRIGAPNVRAMITGVMSAT